MGSPDTVRRGSYALLGVFLFLSLSLGFVGYRHYRGQRASIEQQVRNQLAAVADLKVRQVASWRDERYADAALIAALPMAPDMRNAVAGRADKAMCSRILQWMETVRSVSHYANAILMNRSGHELLSTGRTKDADEHYAELARRVLASNAPIFTDLHYDGGLEGPHMGLLIPLRQGPNTPIEGMLLLAIDPNEFLYPRIQIWPTPSRTAETILVRREGNEVVYLNELRHRAGMAMRLRAPVTETQRPAVAAVLGYEGLMHGIDYRGEPVLAAVRKIPDSPWALVAKVDAAEVYAPIREQGLWLALILAGVVLASAASVGLVWQHMESRFYRHKYEEEAEELRSRALLNAVVETTGDSVFVKDTEGRFLFANTAMCKLVSKPLEQFLGKTDAAILPADVAARIAERDRDILSTGNAVTFEEEIALHDGTSATYFTAKAPLRDQTGRIVGLFGIARDITDRKHSEQERARLQEQLQQAQKMESIGRLAGGVAHDFNNLLTIINGYADLVAMELPSDSPLQDAAAEIGKAGQRAADLTQQLLAFSRKQIIEPRNVDLNDLVRDTSKLLGRLMGEDIAIIPQLNATHAHVMADPSQIHQVMMNLAVNARDAMPQGGRFTIETSNAEITQDDAIADGELRPGRFVLLSVADTGVGMDEETRRHAFEPFFTTKPKGAGTGLGLATVYGIVSQSGGWITLSSAQGIGTTFHIYLPCVDRPGESRPAGGSEAALHGHETVLVVEDQPGVRKLTAEVLKRYGYEVIEVENGEEALTVSREFDGAIQAMITDIVMPGMNGRDLAARLVTLRPSIRVLFMSGYAADVLTSKGLHESGAAFLPKPFAPEALAAKLRELLDGPAPRAETTE